VTDAQISANAEFSINRQDFGIAYPGMPDDLIRDLVVVKLSLTLPRQS
jgi:polyisoprenoid-binding protein YceI